MQKTTFEGKVTLTQEPNILSHSYYHCKKALILAIVFVTKIACDSHPWAICNACGVQQQLKLTLTTTLSLPLVQDGDHKGAVRLHRSFLLAVRFDYFNYKINYVNNFSRVPAE